MGLFVEIEELWKLSKRLYVCNINVIVMKI